MQIWKKEATKMETKRFDNYSLLYLGLPKYVKRLETIKAENKYDSETLKELMKKCRLEKKWDKI